MLRDFNAFLEGDAEDRVYWILAHLEGSYEQNSGWSRESQGEDALWALNLGFEIVLKDRNGRSIVTTEEAIKAAPPMTRKRLMALSQYRAGGSSPGELVPYPLFLKGNQIGTVEIRELRHAKEAVFVRRSDQFLLWSVFIMGGLAVILSILFSTRLTRPIKELAVAASAISRGEYKSRVAVTRRDEVGNLSETFNRMAKALETHESLRRKLIADVAHELRTPLGVMRGELEAMIDGLMPSDPERLQSLYEETGRLKTMVDGIEELNRAEASTLSLRKSDIDLKPFLTHIADRFAASFDEKGVFLEMTCDDSAQVYGDPDRLSQIVVNLLANALRATGGGGRVAILVEGRDGETAITVKDSGTGIRPEDLPHIFERFYRGPGGGLGIGLTIVRELAEAQLGRVEVESDYGKGASFTVCLPSRSLHNSS